MIQLNYVLTAAMTKLNYILTAATTKLNYILTAATTKLNYVLTAAMTKLKAQANEASKTKEDLELCDTSTFICQKFQLISSPKATQGSYALNIAVLT